MWWSWGRLVEARVVILLLMPADGPPQGERVGWGRRPRQPHAAEEREREAIATEESERENRQGMPGSQGSVVSSRNLRGPRHIPLSVCSQAQGGTEGLAAMTERWGCFLAER